MTLEEIKRKHNVDNSSSAGAATETTPTSSAGIEEIRKKHNVNKYTSAQAPIKNVPEVKSESKPSDNTVKIHALGAGETKPTTSRVGKTINAGVQGTMSNFTNFWGWLKESDAAAKARDEADKEYT